MNIYIFFFIFIKMDKLIHIQLKQQTPEWINYRYSVITATDIGTILGYNEKFGRTTLELLNNKVNKTSVNIDNENTRWGNTNESIAVNKYEKKKKCTVKLFDIIQHKTIPHYAFSPDGIVFHDDNNVTIIEVKCPLKRKITSGGIPDYYYAQVQWQLFIMNSYGFNCICDFVEYKPASISHTKKDILSIKSIELDTEWIEDNLYLIEEFYTNYTTMIKKL